MEPILDETSLVPCAYRSPAVRIWQLARTLQALDDVGARRLLRSVSYAADSDLGEGRGLRSWCFDRATERDAGRLVASRLSKQPYIDGQFGLFAMAEGHRAVEATLSGTVVFGAGLAAMTDDLVVLLASEERHSGEHLVIQLTMVDDDGQWNQQVEVQTFASAVEVENYQEVLLQRADRALNSGAEIVSRLGEVFPRLLLGEQASEQIERLTGSETYFRQLIRHLRALDKGALKWEDGKPFDPVGVSYSVDSEPTLQKYGSFREFPTPAGFKPAKYTIKTKLTGGNALRLYFRPERVEERTIVIVGYFGGHLPTVKYPT